MEEKYGSSMFSCCLHDICLRDFCNRRHSFEGIDLMLIVHFNINLPRSLEEYRNKLYIKHCRNKFVLIALHAYLSRKVRKV